MSKSSIAASEIGNFYAGKAIFITGAAGFLGTVLLETLLRCCPDISRIYLLLRTKRGVEAEERKNLIFQKHIFLKLKTSNPDMLKKVIAVSGDTTEENLGLNEEDFNNLTSEVSVIFHLAASISFKRPLGFVVHQNVIGTSNIIDFCRKLENLKAIVYTSSVYACSNNKDVIEEKVYDLPFSAEEIVALGRQKNEDELMRYYQMCNPPFPNFYTFSKTVTENLLKETANDLPVCIIRPSIVLSCLKGALPGYIEPGSAVVNLCLGVGTGFIRVLRIDENKRQEIIPADIVANAHILAAFRQATESLQSPSVYNSVSGELVCFTWGDFVRNFLIMSRRIYVPQAYVYPAAVCIKNLILYKFLSLVFHYMPAAVIDLLLLASGISFRAWKVYKFLDFAMKSVEFVTMNQWDMRNKNFQSLSEGLNAVDDKMFSVDLKDFTFKEITRRFPLGASVYRVNGRPYEEKFKRRCLRYFLTFIVICFYLGIIYGLLYLILFKVI